jgi:branched-chain amino acid transport system substrate-binding protein
MTLGGDVRKIEELAGFRIRRFATAAFALMLSGVIAMACSSGSSSGSSAQGSTSTVKIAVEGPMSGSQAETGNDMWRAVSLLVNSVNDQGGVLGHHIQLVRVNDQADSSIAASVARNAIAQHVVAVIGPYNSSVGLVNLPIYEAAGVIPIRLTSNHLTNGMGITLQPMDYQVAPVESKAILATLPQGSKVAIVYDTAAYTQGVATQLKTLLTQGGLNVAVFDSYPSTATDFTTEIADIKAANPSLIYYASFDPQAEDLVKQASQAGIGGTCLVDGLAAQGSTFIQGAGLKLAQSCVFVGVPSATEFPDSSNYVSKYEAAYHTAPGTWGAFAYDSAALLFHTVTKDGTWQRQTVTQSLFHTTGYSGITGSVTIDPSTGNRDNAPVVILTVNSSGDYVISPTWSSKGTLPTSP